METLWSRPLGALGRLLFAWVGGLLGALLVAVAEAQAAGAETSLSAHASNAPRFGELLGAEMGVLVPIALVVATAVCTASLFLEPERPIAPFERLAALRAKPVLARRHAAALLPLALVASAAWLVVVAHAARAALSDGASTVSGVTLAVVSLAWLIAFAAIALALLAPLRRRLSRLAATTSRAIDPVTTGALGFALAALILGIGVAVGDAGGDGPTPLAILGVLKRHELDLRPVIDLGAIAACAWLAPVALGGRPPGATASAIAGVFVATGPLVTTFEAHALNRRPAVALAIESGAPLGRMGLALARRLTDRDHDGVSPLFGGGDCNDRNANVSPLAVDVPGNGVDEDCSGEDQPLASVSAPVMKRQTISPSAPTPFAGPRLNLLLITVDTLRATELGFMGYDKPTSPSLDALAKESVVFERAYAMASYTGKALAPMLIGKYPSETLRDGGHFNKYFAGNKFLAERLRDAGFFTMGAASHWYFKESSGLTQGFSLFDLSAMPKTGQGETDTSVTSSQLTDVAIRLLGEHAPGRRFFLWVHYFDPHAQYVAHPGAPAFDSDRKSSGAKMRSLYDGEVWFTDRAVGRLLEYVDAQPFGKTTAVALTSDHGEALGEHGIAFQHGFEIWEPLMRVPLVIRAPGLRPHRVPVKRSAIDLVPTLLDLLGLSLPLAELSGESMAADLATASSSQYEERDVYMDMPDGPYTHLRRGLIHGATPGLKLIQFGGRQYQLYDLERDPGETDDLSGDPQRLVPMISAMQQKRATLKEIAVKADTPGVP